MNTINIFETINENDLDVYGHMNNGNYGVYFDKARIALQEAYGIGDKDLIKTSRGLWVIHREIDFKKQASARQEIKISSRFFPYERGIKISMSHQMEGDEGIIATSNTTHCFVDLKTQKPIRPPKDLIERIQARDN